MNRAAGEVSDTPKGKRYARGRGDNELVTPRGDSDRLFAPVMAHSAGENANLPHRPVEHGLCDPRDLLRIVKVDHRGTMFRRRPATKFVVDNLHDLKTKKHPVVYICPEKPIELCFKRELLDFRGTE